MPGYQVLDEAIADLEDADGTNFNFQFENHLTTVLDNSHVMSAWARWAEVAYRTYVLAFRFIVWECGESTVVVDQKTVLTMPYGGDTAYALERIDHSTVAIMYARNNVSDRITADRHMIRLVHWDGNSISFGDEKEVYINGEFGYPGWEYALEAGSLVWDGAFLRAFFGLDTGDGPGGAAEGKILVASYEINNKTLTRVDRREVITIPETGLGISYYSVPWVSHPTLMTDYRVAVPYAVGYSGDDGGGWILMLNLLRDGTVATAENVRAVDDTPYVAVGSSSEIVVTSSPYGSVVLYGTESPYQMIARSMDINGVFGPEQILKPDEWTGIYMWSVDYLDRPIVAHMNWDTTWGDVLHFSDLNADGSLLRDSGMLLKSDDYSWGESGHAVSLDAQRVGMAWEAEPYNDGMTYATFTLFSREPYIEEAEAEGGAPSIVVPESISFENIDVAAHLKDSLYISG